MKDNKKTVIAVIAIITIALTMVFAACETDKKVDTSVDDALALVTKCDTTSVKLTKDNVIYFSFEKSGDQEAVVSDPYGTGVSAEQFIDFAKEIKSSLTAADITVTEKTYSEETGDIKLVATLNDAQKVLGVNANGATLAIDGNLVQGKVNVYKLTYVDANGYNVEIALS